MPRESALRRLSAGQREPLDLWLLWWLGLGLGAVWLLPTYRPPWMPFWHEWMAAAGFAPLMLWGLARWWRHGQMPWLACGLLLLGCVPLLQWAAHWVLFGGDAWMAALYIWGAALALLAGAQVVYACAQRQPQGSALQALDALWLALALAGIGAVGIGLYQWALQDALGALVRELAPRSMRTGGNFSQPNQQASALLLSLAGCALLFETRRIGAATAWALAAWLCMGLALTASRMVWLAGVWMWLIWLLARRRGTVLRSTLAAPAGLTALYAFWSAALPLCAQYALLGGAQAAWQREDSGARWRIWQLGWDAMWQHPWVGYGAQQIKMANQALALQHKALHTTFGSAHNMLLDVALWFGVPVALLLAAALAWWAWEQLRRAKDVRAWVALLALGFLGGHAMVELPLHYAYFLLPFCLLLGAVGAQHASMVWRLRPAWPWGRALYALLSLPALGAGVLLVWVTVEYPIFEEEWINTRFAVEGYADAPALVQRRVVLLDQLYERFWLLRQPVRPAVAQADLDRAARIAQRDHYPQTMWRYAQLAALNGRPQEAVHTIRLLCSMRSQSWCEQMRREWTQNLQVQWPVLRGTAFPVSENTQEQGQ